MMEIVGDDKEVAFKCMATNCHCHISSVVMKVNGKELLVESTCTAGHINIFKYKEERREKPLPKNINMTIRTKVSGVTFKNADGVSRQELLKRLRPGDELEIIKGTLDNQKVYQVRHAIGVIGTLKSDTIRSIDTENGKKELYAKVVQITGGKGEKSTFGCNIELFTRPAKSLVYMDPDGKNIYHKNPHCSGMQDATAVTLEYAKEELRARPCKKCAGDAAGASNN